MYGYGQWKEGIGRPGVGTKEAEVLCALQKVEAGLVDLNWKVDILMRSEEHSIHPPTALGSMERLAKIMGLIFTKQVAYPKRGKEETGPQPALPNINKNSKRP